jgi:hypothetical protein
MLLEDYGKIIIIGLCNSPNHLKEHFEREVLKLSEKYYGRREVVDMLRQVLEMHKNRINELYEKDLRLYKEYSEQDKVLPPKQRYYYPCPELTEISLTYLDFPSGRRNNFPNGRKYTLADFESVEKALIKVFGIEQTEGKAEQEIPETFEGLFYNPEHAGLYLKVLNELNPPVIDADNNYIGKAKGVVPLWVKVLRNNKPKPLIKHFKDTIYKDLLNQKVKGLNLSKDASEFRKEYKRLKKSNIELDIKTILSQYSQSGKLGK